MDFLIFNKKNLIHRKARHLDVEWLWGFTGNLCFKYKKAILKLKEGDFH
tara:strand:+ start:617 stop:763 length:147 start_codon:yes stop_codon:yes gene_type:complete